MNNSFEKFSTLIEYVAKKNEGVSKELRIFKPLSEIEVKAFEEKIGIKLPSSYKEFLKKYGELLILGDSFLGSVDNPGKTLRLKNAGHLLPGFIDIYELGDGIIYCIDANIKDHKGESPIIRYFPGSDMEREDCDFISESFGDFLLETVWNDLIDEGVDLSQHQHLKPKNKGWNYCDDKNTK